MLLVLTVLWLPPRSQAPAPLTTQDLLAYLEGVQYGGGDSRHGADHAAQAQVDKHEEEHDRPEGAGGEVGHGLGEGDEGQPRALHRLEERGAEP